MLEVTGTNDEFADTRGGESADSGALESHRHRTAHRDRTESERDCLQLMRPAAIPAGLPGWRRNSRLRQLEDLIARRGTESDAGDSEIERAVLLGALDRRQDAQQAFVDILRRAPTNFSALNEFGTLLTNMGAIDAACRVYSEAILHHPANPMAHVNLANLLLRANKYDQAREHYEAALRIDPDYAQAHQGLGAVLSDTGDRAGARYHFHKGFRDHAISSLPYRGTEPPVALLQLVSSGGGNIPTASFLDDCVFLTSVIVTDYLDPEAAAAAASTDLQRHWRR